MGTPSVASFINLDLEIDAEFDLSALADHLKSQVFVLFNGSTDTGFRLALEPLIEGALNSDPLVCTEHFLNLLTTLPADLKALWNSSTSRLFDYGFDGGLECPPLRATLPSNLLLQIAQLGANVQVTIYPYREETIDEV